MLENRYIYIFGGFRTTKFKKQSHQITRVNKKHEITENVSSNLIERYDTYNDQQDESDAKMSKI